MLALLTPAAFVIFAQIFMVAPLIPRLGEVFHTSPDLVGLAVPAYLIPYGAMVLVWGPVSEHLGRRPVILGSLAALTALARRPGSTSPVQQQPLGAVPERICSMRGRPTS